MAPPITSARSVAIATASACTQNARRGQGRMRSPSISGSDRPETRPSLAERYWISTAIALAATSTHTRR
ncbi:hypothetical protein QE449_000681 [Rhodococcus sp. SORGH_AS303]|nr:hypothetical protein [Rhodococcus sp. SORGH_AS_0303]